MTSIQTHLCFPPPLLRLSSSSGLAPSSWILIKISLFLPVLKGSSMVRYPFCSLPCIFANEVQLIPGLGLYSGILAIYFQYQSNESTGRTRTIVFYAICLLYVLSTFNFVSDFVALILEVSNNSICSKNIIFYQLCRHVIAKHFFFSLENVQVVLAGCCDFLAQSILVHIDHWTYHPFYSPKSSKIYRCWIVWGRNIRVVIIPSFLAVTYLGRLRGLRK